MYIVEMFGTTYELNPVAFSIGSFEIYWYGVIISIGFLVAMIYGFRRASDYQINTDHMIDVILFGTIGGVLGARTYYVLTTLDHYDSFLDMIDIRDGGLAIYGGVIGAILFGTLACLWRKINILDMYDLAAPAFLIGQSVGRWGNFMNQEAFGSNTNLPWGMFSDGTQNQLINAQEALSEQGITVDPYSPVHPCFLYESLWCIIGFVLIYLLSKKVHFKGETALHYLIWYGLGRFFIEQVRTDSLMVGPLKISQLVAAVCVIGGIILLITFLILNRKAKTDDNKSEPIMI